LASKFVRAIELLAEKRLPTTVYSPRLWDLRLSSDKATNCAGESVATPIFNLLVDSLIILVLETVDETGIYPEQSAKEHKIETRIIISIYKAKK
jgi:hypothetical protein